MGNNRVHKTIKWYISLIKGIPYTLAAVLFCVVFWVIQGAAFAKGEGVLTETVENAKTGIEITKAGIAEIKEGDPGTDGDTQAGADTDSETGTDGDDLSGADAEDIDSTGSVDGVSENGSGEELTGEENAGEGGINGADTVSDSPKDSDETTKDSEKTEEENTRSTAFVTVDDSYFDDALFIGDSRMVGIYDYCGWENATFLCDNGYSIANYMVDRKVRCQKDQTKHTPEEVLDAGTFGKVYVMIGTNDAPHKDLDDFREGYASLISLIRDKQPEAVIYVVANLNMTKNGEVKNSGRGFTNEAIKNLNAIIQEFDNGDDIFFLDFNPLFSDDEGYLDGSYSFDGFHVYATQYSEMGQFFREHAVEYSTII